MVPFRSITGVYVSFPHSSYTRLPCSIVQRGRQSCLLHVRIDIGGLSHDVQTLKYLREDLSSVGAFVSELCSYFVRSLVALPFHFHRRLSWLASVRGAKCRPYGPAPPIHAQQGCGTMPNGFVAGARFVAN